MAITGTGSQTNPWRVDTYSELKSKISSLVGDGAVYIVLNSNIDCNDYGDSFEWTTIQPHFDGETTWYIDLGGNTIKNIMIAKDNCLFGTSTGHGKDVYISNGKLLNIFNNGASSILSATNYNKIFLENVSMSVNGEGVTEEPFKGTYFNKCSLYYVSTHKSGAKGKILTDGTADYSDFYISQEEGGTTGIAMFYNFVFSNSRLRGKLKPLNLLNSTNNKFSNCVFDM